MSSSFGRLVDSKGLMGGRLVVSLQTQRARSLPFGPDPMCVLCKGQWVSGEAPVLVISGDPI